MEHVRNTANTRLFFRSMLSVYAACALLALPAFGQSGDAQNNDAQGETAANSDATSAPDAQQEDVNVTDYGTVDLAVQDTDLAQVLQMLSMQSRKNIITSKSVSATVSANLYDVTFEEALQAILHVNGYDYIEDGNFIYIYTQAEIEEIERARRQTESRIFELEHLSAQDAREFVQPLLSDVGQLSHRGEVRPGFKPDLDDAGADEYAYAAKIVVNDYPERLDAIGELLYELDTPPQQVLVEATVLRTTLDEDNQFGIDFSILGSVDFSDFFTPFSAVDDLLFKGQPDSPVDNTAGSPATEDTGHRPVDERGRAFTSQTTQAGQGLRVGIMHDNVSVFLKVLDEVTDSTVLARPKIMALNRQRAEVLVGEKVPFRSSTATDTSVTQEIKFLNTGIELTFRPFISRNGMIRMELKPKVSFAIREQVAANETAPREFTNELTTNVRVRDGQTLVLGGLFEEDIQKTRRQVPILGDIPLLGAAFRGHEDRIRKNEIIFLITPTILNDEVLWELGRDSLTMTEHAQVGARKGLLPFSRERITANHNKKAIEAYNRGDMDRAEYHINNSLRLKSDQPEMVRLRQQVTGVRANGHDRGILEGVLRRHLERDVPDDAVMTPQNEGDIPATDAPAVDAVDVVDSPEAEADGEHVEATDEFPMEEIVWTQWPAFPMRGYFPMPIFRNGVEIEPNVDADGEIADAQMTDEIDESAPETEQASVPITDQGGK